MRRSTFGVVLGTDAAAVWLCRPHWAQLHALIAGPTEFLTSNGADRTVGVAALAASWAIAVWLGIGLAAAVTAALPGSLGRVGAQLAAAVLPRALQRLAAATTGLAVLATPVAAIATTPDRGPGPAVSASVSSSLSDGASIRPVGTVATPASPGGVAPSGAAPRGVAPSGVAPGGVAPGGVGPATWPTDIPPARSTTTLGPPASWPTEATPGTAAAGLPAAPTTSAPTTSAPITSAPAASPTVVSAPATWPTTPTGNPAVTPTMPTGTTTMPTGTAADPAASQSASAPAGPAQSPGPSGAAVQVRAGDCLWLIAARRLGPGATPAQVAASWPAWYAANRSVIGADPRVVRPGELLVPPTVLDAKTSSGASDNPTWRTTKGWTP